MKKITFYIAFILLATSILTSCEDKKEKFRFEMNSGLKHLSNSRIDEAEKHFINAMEINPQNAESYMYLGRIEMNRRNYDKALVYFDKALELSPNLGEVYRSKAQIFDSRHDKKKACENYKLAEQYGVKNLANYLMGCE